MFVVLFEVQPHAEQRQQYLDFGRLLRPELEQVDGFIDNERFASAEHPGRVLSLSTWRDEKALIRWRTHAQHHQVQQQGRDMVFADYLLRVGEVTDDGAPLASQQRFDQTETGGAKAIVLIELAPEPQPLHEQLARAATVDPARAPDGWVEGHQFVSLYQPGKRVHLSGWASAAAARSWYAAQIAPLERPALRSRFVRVIRSYGMRDRHEAPQYYAPAASIAAIW